MRNKPYLIAGIDPGTTTAIAILDFNGKILNLFSSKDLGLDRVIEHLLSFGKVSIIATDVHPAPEFVSKLVTKLGSRLFMPGEPLRIGEKITLARDYKARNSHERDALSAAINAFNKFRNKFEKIESLGYGDDVKHLVTQGISIENAIEKLREKEVLPEKPEIQPVIEISEEKRRIRSLEKQNEMLRKIIAEKDNEIKRLRLVISEIRRRFEFRLRKIRKSAESEERVKHLRDTINSLNEKLKEIDKLREIWKKSAKKELIPVGIFPEVNSGIVLIKRRLRREDLGNLEDIEIALIENESDRDYLEEKGIITASPDYIKEISGCFYITTEDLNKIRELKKILLDRIVEDYRKKRVND